MHTHCLVIRLGCALGDRRRGALHHVTMTGRVGSVGAGSEDHEDRKCVLHLNAPLVDLRASMASTAIARIGGPYLIWGRNLPRLRNVARAGAGAGGGGRAERG